MATSSFAQWDCGAASVHRNTRHVTSLHRNTRQVKPSRLQVPLGDRAAMATSRFVQWDRGAALTNLLRKSGPHPEQGLDEAVDQWAASGHWQASPTCCSCAELLVRMDEYPVLLRSPDPEITGLNQAVALWAGLFPFSCCFRDHAFTFGTCILKWPGREASPSKTPCATEVTRVHTSNSAINCSNGRACASSSRRSQTRGTCESLS